MPRIDPADVFIRIGDTRIEAAPIADLFRMDVEAFERAVRDGSIESTKVESAETGSDPNTLHLIFRSAERQVHVIAERNGAIRSCRAEPLERHSASSSDHQDTERSDAAATDPPENRQTAADADLDRRAHLDQLLDEALSDTFPASDPIAISSD